MRRFGALLLAIAATAACKQSPFTSDGHRETLRQGPTAFAGAGLPALGPSYSALTVANMPAGCASVSYELRVLVLSSGLGEADLPAIRQALEYHGIPYDVWDVTLVGALTDGSFANGCVGKYQGVILTNDQLPLGANWSVLQQYEASFGVRELAWYAWPGPGRGLDWPTSWIWADGTTSATATAAGQAVFDYVPAGAIVPIANASTSFATPLAQGGATPLVVDPGGNALVSTWTSPDGRELMTVTFDSNASLLHDLVFAHGFVEWVTKGVYLGQYRAYLAPEVDDMFVADDLYPVNQPSDGLCGTAGYPACVCDWNGTQPTLPACQTYLMTPTDVTALVNWQRAVQAQAGNSGFKLSLAFNGLNGPNALTAAAVQRQWDFGWINHTWQHLNLDYPDDPIRIGPMTTAAQTANAFTLNERFVAQIGLKNYRSLLFVSPDVSGLGNPAAMSALAKVGVRYMVTDTSHPEWGNPSPNVGMYSPMQPDVYLVPRRPVNLFYDVSTPQEWADQYNALYASQLGTQTFDQILDRESGVLLGYLLVGDLDPQMYHQANLRSDATGASLLSRLVDAAIAKYRQYSLLPIQSPSLDQAGRRMKELGGRNEAGVVATFDGVNVTMTSARPARVSLTTPRTGTSCPAGAEAYFDACIRTVSVGSAPVTVQ